MMIYVYECNECDDRFEREQGMTEPPLKVCPGCGGEVRRVIQPVGIIFKGSGFYTTDHREDCTSSSCAHGKSRYNSDRKDDELREANFGGE